MNTREKMIELEESAEHDNRMRAIAQNGNSGEHYTTTMTYEQESINMFDVIDAKEVKEPTKAELRKGMPVFSGVLKYFPNAIKEVAKCSKVGNDQHHPDKPLHWDMDKSKDEYDALTRHLIDHTINPMDDDGVLHLAKVAWRALAGLERHLTNKD
ncbi:DUF5664 domain-containing protein [bacterium]|nr:DUF5664 domain-containing protein [bacterium]